jgi:hypothetical protein
MKKPKINNCGQPSFNPATNRNLKKITASRLVLNSIFFPKSNASSDNGLNVVDSNNESPKVESKQASSNNGLNVGLESNEASSESPEVTKKRLSGEKFSRKDSHKIPPSMSPLAESDGGKGSAEASASKGHSSKYSKTPSKKKSTSLKKVSSKHGKKSREKALVSCYHKRCIDIS